MPDLETWLRIGLAFGLFWQAGFLLLGLIRLQELSWIERVCLAFGLGVGAITYEMLIMSLIGLPLNAWLISLPWAVAWGLRAARLKPWKNRPALFNRIQPVLQWSPQVILDGALSLMLGAMIVVVLFRATFFPVTEWDGWAIWDLKAQAFFHQRGLFPFVNDTYYALTHLDYPLLYPLVVSL